MDNFSIADTFHLRRTVHRPQKDPVEPVFVPEKPWETAVIAGKIVFDEKKKLWRMWYVGYDHNAKKIRKGLKKQVWKSW